MFQVFQVVRLVYKMTLKYELLSYYLEQPEQDSASIR